ncbi:HAD-IA family hydrolase [Deinococcus sonorensis]|uniref:HAD-IA family hydrolase n=2 Tax=Deinococcus sonorensis TaxID=309891 RepID=A0AAU7U7U3_9DEIO
MSQRVLLMDVDGVLVTPPSMYGSVMLQRHPETMLRFFKGPFLEASCGRADLPDLLPPLLAELGYTGTREQFMLDWFRHEDHLNRPLLEAVRALRQDGWPCYLATNQERHRLHYLLHDMQLSEVVDGELASCSVGVRKPDPAYYQRVTERLQRAPGQIVFWDDDPGNVQAAQAAGWQAHLYRDVAQFRQTMSRSEVLLP